MTSTPGSVTTTLFPAGSLQSGEQRFPNVDVSYLYKVLNRQKQTGLYVQDQAQWDKVLVTLGGRYDWADQESYNRVTNTTSKR
jgi:outer membrane receptor protein involved in Fe transport